MLPRLAFASLFVAAAHAHRLAAHVSQRHPPVRCSSAPDISFTTGTWQTLQKHLDTLPVFTCVNEDGEPLGYERDGEQLAIYFSDVDRAKLELETMGEKFPTLGLRLIGVGLGDVFRQHTEGRALLVPSQEALAGAGDDWDSETLPLYTCLSMSSKAPEGSGLPAGVSSTPLFLCPKDAQASLQAALEAAKASGASEAALQQLQLVCTSMPTAVELVLSGKEKETCGDRFQFVAPRSSLFFLREQQQKRSFASQVDDSRSGGGLLFPS